MARTVQIPASCAKIKQPFYDLLNTELKFTTKTTGEVMKEIEGLAIGAGINQEYHYEKSPKVNSAEINTAAAKPKENTKAKKESFEKAVTETRTAATYFKSLNLSPSVEFTDSPDCKA